MKTLIIALAFGGFLFVNMVLALDALEYEVTGECKNCILLDKVRNI